MTFTEAGHTYEAGDDEHDTPLEFFEPIARHVDGFDLDPSASDTSNLAERNVTKDEDGLSIEWYGNVWLNPPYSEVSDWMEYANQQHVLGNTDLIVCLVYARTGTRWYHRFVKVADMVCFVQGRLTFGNGDYSAPAPSMVVVYGDPPTELRNHLLDEGHVIVGGETQTEATSLGQFGVADD